MLAASMDRLGILSGFGLLLLAGTTQGVVVPNLVVPPGFRVGLFAGPEWVEDARALTVHESGAVLVAGPGYLRVLRDLDGNGVADGVAEFAPPPDAAAVPSGLWAEPGFVYWVGTGGIWRYVDLNRDGVADGLPARLLTMAGAQTLVRGPDGWWYLSGQQGASWSELAVRGMPSDGASEGAVVRINPAFDSAEWLAGGLATGRRLAFNSWGELFLADEGVNATVPLPWETSSGLWHLARGARHGWGRRTSRPSYYAGQAPAMASFGSSRITGVISYRHYQYPPRYRDGLFALDWAAGRVWFVPVQGVGATYVGRPELFVDSLGLGAFTPIDAAVARDGSLLVASGDRKTRASVYRIQHVGDPAMTLLATNWVSAALTPLRAVLTAPEPLAAWSRAYWVATAVQIGRAPFDAVVTDPNVSALWRARSIEVLTEVFSGLSAAVAEKSARAVNPLVRARTAWSIGRAPCEGCASVLTTLALDPDVAVRRVALEAVLDQVPLFGVDPIQGVITANLSHPEGRLRQLAARLASFLPEEAWEARWSAADKLDPVGRMTLGLALLWRQPAPAQRLELLKPVLKVLADDKAPPDRVVEGLRLFALALQDWSDETPVGFVGADLLPWSAEQRQEILSEGTRRLADANPIVAMESARLVALLADDRPAVSAALSTRLAEETAPAVQLHYLFALARLQGHIEHPAKLADVLMGLAKKPEIVQRRGQRYWPRDLVQVMEQLFVRHPALVTALIEHPDFAVPANLEWIPQLGLANQDRAARRFLAALRETPAYPWSPELVRLLGMLPVAEIAPVLRPVWRVASLREDIVRVLARAPDTLDRDKFIWGLGSSDLDLVRSCLDALMTLPKIGSPLAMASAARLLDRLLDDPRQFLLRAQVLRVLELQTGQSFDVHEQGAAPEVLRGAYQPVFQWLARKHPSWARRYEAAGHLPPWRRRVEAAVRINGDPARGQMIFQQRRCAECHHGPAAFGPALAGRLGNPEDFFRALFFPDEQMAPGYQPVQLRTRTGAEVTGLLVWESPLGVLVNTGPSETGRFAWRDIADAQPATTSLMPKNLLDRMSPRDLADLQAFVGALGR